MWHYFVEMRSHPFNGYPLSLSLVAVCGTRELANRDHVLGACVRVCQALSARVCRVWTRSRHDELCRNRYLGRAGQIGGLRPTRCADDKDLWRMQK